MIENINFLKQNKTIVNPNHVNNLKLYYSSTWNSNVDKD